MEGRRVRRALVRGIGKRIAGERYRPFLSRPRQPRFEQRIVVIADERVRIADAARQTPQIVDGLGPFGNASKLKALRPHMPEKSGTLSAAAARAKEAPRPQAGAPPQRANTARPLLSNMEALLYTGGIFNLSTRERRGWWLVRISG
jgi:hypothetical protein